MVYKCFMFTGLGLRGIPSVLCDLIRLSRWAAGVIVSGALWDGMLETCIQYRQELIFIDLNAKTSITYTYNSRCDDIGPK